MPRFVARHSGGGRVTPPAGRGDMRAPLEEVPGEVTRQFLRSHKRGTNPACSPIPQRFLERCVLVAALATFGFAAASEIRVTDDSGRSMRLEQPVRRVISLAPHITELLFAAGAGERIVGAVDFSDFPEAAKRIPRVGNNAQLDLERIVALKPDLIVVWLHGNAQRQLDRLLELGIPAFYTESHRLGDIARSIEQLGRLAGTEAVAAAAARAFKSGEAELRARYAGLAPVSIYFQIWGRPLMTINGNHIISDVIRLCGGRNVFADLAPIVPSVSIEAVLAADPEAIGGTIGEMGSREDMLAWLKWPQLRAVARGNLFTIHADFMTRHTPRILEGARQMCAQLDAARERRGK